MLGYRRRVAILAVLAALVASPAAAVPGLSFGVFEGRSSAACPKFQRSPQHFCNVVVNKPGGHPTQDRTGSIGHSKSHQSNGGPGCKVICVHTGSNYGGIR